MALIKLNNQSLSAVTSAGLPSGAIVNMEISEITASSTRATATSYADDLDFGSYTPVLTNSTVFIQGVANLDSDFQVDCHYKWVINGSAFLSTGSTPISTHAFSSYTSLDNVAYVPSTIITSVSNTDGSSITAVCQGKVNSGTLYINRSASTSQSGSPSSVIFIEVAN